MERQTKTIRLADEVSRVEEEIEEVLDEAEDLDGDSDEYEEKEMQYKALEIQRRKLQEKVDSWDDDAFEIQELSFGQLMAVRDEVMAVSDAQNPREGLYRVRVLSEAVTSCPDKLASEPKEWPSDVAEWVYEEVDSMNTGVDEQTLANLSMEEALENR